MNFLRFAIGILSIYTLEACVKRSFSILPNIHILKRNSLNDDIIDTELSIKINLKN